MRSSAAIFAYSQRPGIVIERPSIPNLQSVHRQGRTPAMSNGQLRLNVFAPIDDRAAGSPRYGSP
jgi:hypothetical protein